VRSSDTSCSRLSEPPPTKEDLLFRFATLRISTADSNYFAALAFRLVPAVRWPVFSAPQRFLKQARQRASRRFMNDGARSSLPQYRQTKFPQADFARDKRGVRARTLASDFAFAATVLMVLSFVANVPGLLTLFPLRLVSAGSVA
jgi:hypothetical protein